MYRDKEQVRKWVHKETKAVIKATPWWEIPEEMFSDKDFGPLMPDQRKIGILVQIGWLLMNESGVWLGVGMTAQEAFDDAGAWKKSDKIKEASPKKPKATARSISKATAGKKKIKPKAPKGKSK